MHVETALSTLGGHPDYRVLTRIPGSQPILKLAANPGPLWKSIGVVDCETTGLDPEDPEIIELSIGILHLDTFGRVHSYETPRTWLEQPLLPLSDEIADLTGLTDDMLTGQKIGDEEVAMLVRRTDLLVSWNASFDARFFEGRFPGLRGLCWGCAMSEVDWKARGLEPGKQSHVLMQQGYFYTPHRAGDDVAALMTCLGDPGQGDRLPSAELFERSSRQSAILWARHSEFGTKDRLKARGYRWDPRAKSWWIELDEELVGAECDWLREADCRVRPEAVSIDWTDRHRT